MFSPRIALAGALSSAAALAFATVLALPAFGAVEQQTCDNTSTTISASPPSPVNGATNVSITAHVSDLDQTPLTPVGTVQFFKDSTLIGTPAVDGSGNATTNTFMSTGFHTLSAKYGGGTTNNVTFCATTASTSYLVNGVTPTPTSTPTPGPVGLPAPSFPNCEAAFAAGVSNIPSTDSRYRRYLDRDHDGVACELNGNDGGVVGDNVQYRVINGKKCHQVDGAWVPVTVVAPPTCTSCSAPPPVIYQAPQVVAPAPVFVAPAPVYSAPIVPSGPAATGR